VFLRRLARLPFLAVRRLRWWSGSWSKDSDRQYHEQLYQAQDHDPFRADYPGYVTIRRFADHVEALIPAAGTVLDVGCGPGEITCELARRHRGLSFVGIDHSEQAIQRANQNAVRLGLTNVRFQVGDAERLPPEDRYGLVTMFDAFHHLERPREFLAWLRTRASRCVLIEPAGTWTGRWARSLDLDWLLSDLANIRDRVEAACGETTIANDGDSDGGGKSGSESKGGSGSGSASERGSGGASESQAAASRDGQTALQRGEGAVERRYALDDFASFFEGWHLRVTGTIAGFDAYPPKPYARSALRPVTGEIAYALVREIEALLEQRDRDGAAKHWVIAATTEAGVLQPRLPGATTIAARDLPERRVTSAFDVRYQTYDGPTRVHAGAQFRATLEILNAGWDEWRSDGDTPVRVSYHWLTRAGEITEFDGLRSPLPRPIGPGDTCHAFVAVTAPADPGDYVLALDLVKEGVSWFSEAGMPWYTVPINVTGR
jgi:SAM-dependent methyltransferase